MQGHKAIILFSGGLDSTTCLAIAKSHGYECHALSFQYGQKNESEVTFARRSAASFGVKQHLILPLPIGVYGGSSLTDHAMPVPDYDASSHIPSTYVPARNTIFLSFALSYGEVIGAHDIFIGANIMDYSGYPDCRPEYFAAFEKMTSLGTKFGSEGKSFKIHAPLLSMTKADIVRQGISLGVDYSQTVSCYRADHEGRACGRCDSCIYRKKGFQEAGVLDPTLYSG